MNISTNNVMTINTPDELTVHIKNLIKIEPRFSLIYEQVGTPDLRRQRGGFIQLMRAIVGQQISVAAASSIWNKLSSADLISPTAIAQVDDETLKTQGLSRQKIRYIRSLVEHNIDFDALEQMPDYMVRNTLTAVVGIGNWTAEMYMLFSLGRADVIAVDDLAIKVAAMDLLDLQTRPTPKNLKALTQSWSPHRSAASLLLWTHYGRLKNREAVPL